MSKRIDINDIDINDIEVLKELRRVFKPVGSGPLSVMRVVVKLIDAIAKEKGFEIE